jgi:glycerate 2-kinase
VKPVAPSCRILIAFDKLKDALTAEEACDIAVDVLRRQHPDWILDRAPLSDGGEGFCRVLTEAAGGTLHETSAHGPHFVAARAEPVRAPLGLIDLTRLPAPALALLALPAPVRHLAIVEMAAVNGLGLVPAARREVWHAGSQGTGELLLEAKRLGADAILLGVGGSATSDLGLGALAALGFRFEDAAGALLAPIVPALWPRLMRVRAPAALELPPLRIACDVDNPLLGERGAAAVYGPQKGLAQTDLARFDGEARRVAELLCRELVVSPALANVPGAGAAGGISFGLMAAAGARLVPGFALVAAWLDLDVRIAQAERVITGEGRFDSSSLAGKGPHAIAQRAAAHQRRCTVFAGSVATEPGRVPGVELIEISPPGLTLAQALAQTRTNLVLALERWGSAPQR